MNVGFLLPFIITASTLGYAGNANADLIKRNMPACISEEYLDELGSYAAQGDTKGHSQLYLAGKCMNLKAGDSVLVISPGFLRATVRYKGLKLFTFAEALR